MCSLHCLLGEQKITWQGGNKFAFSLLLQLMAFAEGKEVQDRPRYFPVLRAFREVGLWVSLPVLLSEPSFSDLLWMEMGSCGFTRPQPHNPLSLCLLPLPVLYFLVCCYSCVCLFHLVAVGSAVPCLGEGGRVGGCSRYVIDVAYNCSGDSYGHLHSFTPLMGACFSDKVCFCVRHCVSLPREGCADFLSFLPLLLQVESHLLRHSSGWTCTN